MKNLLFLLALLLMVGCSKEPINYEETLNERDGVFYTKDTNKPYSGPVFSLFHDGKMKEEGNLKDGWVIRIYYNPLVIWIWIGVSIIFIGGLISLKKNLRILKKY